MSHGLVRRGEALGTEGETILSWMLNILVDCGCSCGFQRGARSRITGKGGRQLGGIPTINHVPCKVGFFQNVPWEFPASSLFKLQPQLTTISRLPTTALSTKCRDLITNVFSVLRLDYNTALLCKMAVTINMICGQKACYSLSPRWLKIEIFKNKHTFEFSTNFDMLIHKWRTKHAKGM